MNDSEGRSQSQVRPVSARGGWCRHGRSQSRWSAPPCSKEQDLSISGRYRRDTRAL